MLTLDEAIKHCKEVAQGMTEQGECQECAKEHMQLAAWLEELRDRRASEVTPTHKAWGHLIRWLCGGLLYGGLEILWRGYTHWTMILLALLLSIPLDIANERIPWTLPLWLQAVIGGLTITVAELAAGLVLNLWFGLEVWDYTGLRGNLWGQICPQYAALWCLLAGPVIVLFDWLDHWLCGGERPRYRLI